MSKQDEMASAAADSANVLDKIATGNAQNTHGAENAAADPAAADQKPAQNPEPEKPAKKKVGRPGRPYKCYRFTLSVPEEYHRYLKAAAYHASDETHTVTITQYINQLIRLDMESHHWDFSIKI